MWLLKTEPSSYGYDDLERDGRATWDGVKNPVAIANLRKMKEGDAVFIYHTGDEKAVVGTALVTRAAYPDPKNPALVVVDLEPTGRLARGATLADMRKMSAFAESPLVRQPRLSVVPLTKPQWNALARIVTE